MPRGVPNKDNVVALSDPKGLGIERVRKITISRAVGKEQMTEQEKGADTKWLVDLYCYVTDVGEEESPMGKFERWGGEFRSINLIDGTILESGQIILPAIANDVVKSAYRAGKGNAICVAMRVGINHDANKVGYKYSCKIINPDNAVSPIDMLYMSANPQAAQIEGPSAPANAIASQDAAAAAAE